MDLSHSDSLLHSSHDDLTPHTTNPAKAKRIKKYKIVAFALTALLYATAHATRTTWGFIKPRIHSTNEYYTNSRLGVLDFIFMMSYAVGQYFSGWLGDRINLKVFLFMGTTSAIVGLCLFSTLEGFYALNMFGIDIFAFILNGLGQSTGYPGCVTIVSNWFSDTKSGLIFGLWGTCLSIGDIIGQQIGNIVIDVLDLPWQYAIYTVCGLLAFFLLLLVGFVKLHPKEIKSIIMVEGEEIPTENLSMHASFGANLAHSGQGIGLLAALSIKHVPLYAMAFFCVKGVIYGVIFWLPSYLKEQVKFEGDISLLLASIEIGQLVGSVFFGYLSDKLKSKSLMISFGFFFSVIFLVLTYLCKGIQIKSLHFALLFVAGMGVGGPASLIGGAVSSDLGQRLAKKNAINAISTIAGIMEGCGATGAALTQLFVSTFNSITFPFFAVLCFLGGCLMVPVAIDDYQRSKKRAIRRATAKEEAAKQEIAKLALEENTREEQVISI